MWLINTKSLTLEFVTEPLEHSYAVLSHTWEEDEISFQEFQNLSPEELWNRKSFNKIQQTCRLAAEYGLQHAWVDTCCIDKSSSAELSEAINSMFKWYMNSAICIVFLSDLKPKSSFKRGFPLCRWLKRGWPLQELIAPRKAAFYDAHWKFRGYKSELITILSAATRIDKAVLEDSQAMHNVPVAKRMSWASSRQTTRIEDEAYFLLGIFDINMPMIYGEGSKAFRRLQEEIAKSTNDLSLFAWTAELPKTGGRSEPKYRGIFAKSPREFASAHGLRSRSNNSSFDKEFTITNKGLRIKIIL
ncbi:hypothetical protein M426DRAFT_60897, partial [Hypoxylon sp. CI-4A]